MLYMAAFMGARGRGGHLPPWRALAPSTFGKLVEMLGVPLIFLENLTPPPPPPPPSHIFCGWGYSCSYTNKIC